jgi:hypothetical protein
MAVAAIATLPLCLANLPDHAPSFKAAGSLILLGTAGTGIAFLWFIGVIRDRIGRHEDCIGDVRGLGAMWAMELVTDRVSREPGKEAAEAGRANAEAGRAKAENAARVALANLDPAAATEVMKLL